MDVSGSVRTPAATGNAWDEAKVAEGRFEVKQNLSRRVMNGTHPKVWSDLNLPKNGSHSNNFMLGRVGQCVMPGKTVIELYPSFVDMWVACFRSASKPWVSFWIEGKQIQRGKSW